MCWRRWYFPFHFGDIFILRNSISYCLRPYSRGSIHRELEWELLLWKNFNFALVKSSYSPFVQECHSSYALVEFAPVVYWELELFYTRKCCSCLRENKCLHDYCFSVCDRIMCTCIPWFSKVLSDCSNANDSVFASSSMMVTVFRFPSFMQSSWLFV